MLKTTAHSSLLAERLSRSEIFGDICLEDRLAIAELCSEETYDEGEPLLIEGEVAEKLFVIERGKVSLEKRVQLGRHSTPRNATLNYIIPYKMTGFSALVYPYIYTTSAVCVEPARVIVLDGPSLRAYLDMHPAVGLKVMDKLTALIGDRYRQATSTLTYFLSVVSHELRSPLAAVENYLHVMLEGYAGELTPKQERMLKRCIGKWVIRRSRMCVWQPPSEKSGSMSNHRLNSSLLLAHQGVCARSSPIYSITLSAIHPMEAQ